MIIPGNGQSAYVKGRTIFDAIRTIEDVMEFTSRHRFCQQNLLKVQARTFRLKFTCNDAPAFGVR